MWWCWYMFGLWAGQPFQYSFTTLSNNISAWNQCRTLNSSFHCSFRGLSGPQFQFGFYLWNLIWITSLTQLAQWQPSMRMCPILTSTTSQGAIFIISPILHNLTSITVQGGHNFPIPLIASWRATSRGSSYKVVSGGWILYSEPNYQGKATYQFGGDWNGWLKWQPIHDQTITDDCLSNDPPNAKEESYKQVIFFKNRWRHQDKRQKVIDICFMIKDQ